MGVILLPTSYLPPVGYMKAMAENESAIIDIHENYIKQTIRNRCYIYTANGIMPLVVPVRKIHGHRTAVKDIVIFYGTKWSDNHWRAIESAYNSSPFFLYYKDELTRIWQRQYTLLADLNHRLMEFLFRSTGITVDLIHSDHYITDMDPELNFRRKASWMKPGVKTCQSYHQVFTAKYGFMENLSIIDLLFNTGPEAKIYLAGNSK